MILRIPSDDCAIRFEAGYISFLQICDKLYYYRLVSSIVSGKDLDACLPFCIEEEGKMIKSSNVLSVETDFFHIDPNSRILQSFLYKRLEQLLQLDTACEKEILDAASTIQRALTTLSFGLSGDYNFGLQWDIQKYLKAFEFKSLMEESNSLLDNLIILTKVFFDTFPNRVLVLPNIQSLLSLSQFIEYANLVAENQQQVLVIDSSDPYVGIENVIFIKLDSTFLVSENETVQKTVLYSGDQVHIRI